MEPRAHRGRASAGRRLSTPWPPEIESARALAKLELGVDHVRGPAADPVVLEYGDYECPYSRAAFRAIEHVEHALGGRVRFAFRHFPLVEIHPHALAAAMAAEAAALQGRFWEMHERLFHHQHALEDDDLRAHAREIGLDIPRFERERHGSETLVRVERDRASGEATGQVQGTPTLFVDGVVHRGAYDPASLRETIERARL